MAIDLDQLKSSTAQHLQSYAGLDNEAAATLVKALCEAAQAELLTMVSGNEPYPTSMSDLRALRLRYICQSAGKLLTPREVAVLFRTTDSAAQTLLTRMERLYPAAVDQYLDALVAEGYWKPAGGSAKDTRVILFFRQLGALEHAVSKLERAGVTDMQVSRSALTIETPEMLPSGKKVTEYLGMHANRRQ